MMEDATNNVNQNEKKKQTKTLAELQMAYKILSDALANITRRLIG